MADTWVAVYQGVAFAANKYMAVAFNASGSGRFIHVARVWRLNNQTAAVTGTLGFMEWRRITAQTAGTAVTPVALDTNNAALPGQFSFNHNASAVTDAGVMMPMVWNSDEPALATGTWDEWETIVPLNLIWDTGLDNTNLQTLNLREGQGGTIKAGAALTAGLLDTVIEFTNEGT